MSENRLSFSLPVRDGAAMIDSIVSASKQATARPDVDAPRESLDDYPLQLIRVLDDDHQASGEWASDLPTPRELLDGLRHMVTVRTLDARLLRAHRQGKISFYMRSLGEEAIACGHQMELAKGDMNFPTYRLPGLLVASGYPLRNMVNQVFSNSADTAKGRQLPVFYTSKEHGFFTISGNLGTQYIQAVGWAMASAISGDHQIASAWIGDGATAESDFAAGLLFASTYQAPVILNIVNNQWAISTFDGYARGAAETFAQRGLGYGIPSLRADGNDYLAVRAVTKWAAERARRNLGPTLIEWVTYRTGAHSTSDDPSAYRDSDESEQWPLGDPVERLKMHLITTGAWSEEQHLELEGECEQMVQSVVAEAEALGTIHDGPSGSPSSMFDDVFAEMPNHLREQRQQSGY